MAIGYHRPGLATAYPQGKPPRRRVVKIALLFAFIITLFIVFSASPVPAPVQPAKDAAQQAVHHAAQRISPFRPVAHKPPVQRNSTSGEAKWFSDWKWLKPFSESVTLDETRSVLPPIKARPPIYTFHDTGTDKDKATKAAENNLLLTWRRAWWAQGFRPVILGRAEAMMNPLYERFQVRKMENTLEAEFVRWLAWGQMGSGILANWLVLPMGSYDDRLLSYLRHGDYPRLTRYEHLGNGLFSGDKASIEAALLEALNSPKLKTSKTIIDAVEPITFSVDPKPNAIAFYESTTIAEHYKSISAALHEGKSAGLFSLAQLITSHLHLTFLNTFSAGLSVLTPYPFLTRILTQPATSLANALIRCPSISLPSSCPPNNLQCTPCSSDKPLSITTPESFPNTSSLFTIGTTPHPYTLRALLSPAKVLDVRYIRRHTKRDQWLQAVTRETLGDAIGGLSRIVPFKDMVASEWGAARGLWITEETTLSRRDVEWHFGFELPAYNSTSIAFLTALAPNPQVTKHPVSEKDLRQQQSLLDEAKEILRRPNREEGIRPVIEAWNLADTEAWRFVRAFGAREVVERAQWEEEEKKFAGGEERDKGWGRWFDR